MVFVGDCRTWALKCSIAKYILTFTVDSKSKEKPFFRGTSSFKTSVAKDANTNRFSVLCLSLQCNFSVHYLLPWPYSGKLLLAHRSRVFNNFSLRKQPNKNKCCRTSLLTLLSQNVQVWTCGKIALLYNLAAVEAANLVKNRPKVKSPTFPAAQARGDHTSTARL